MARRFGDVGLEVVQRERNRKAEVRRLLTTKAWDLISALKEQSPGARSIMVTHLGEEDETYHVQDHKGADIVSLKGPNSKIRAEIIKALDRDLLESVLNLVVRTKSANLTKGEINKVRTIIELLRDTFDKEPWFWASDEDNGFVVFCNKKTRVADQHVFNNLKTSLLYEIFQAALRESHERVGVRQGEVKEEIAALEKENNNLGKILEDINAVIVAIWATENNEKDVDIPL